ncbi:MAG: hypothetical protein AAF664_20270 [Planctomycetota bacterium]
MLRTRQTHYPARLGVATDEIPTLRRCPSLPHGLIHSVSCKQTRHRFVFDAELIDATTNTTFNTVVRATAVPVPASLSLLGLGSLLIMCRRSKFNRHKESV